LMYHIPLVDQWLRVGGLYAPDCEVWYNPSNNELLALWCAAPFSGDFLIGLASLPGAALLALGTIETARALGLRAASAHLAGLAAVSNFVVLRQVVDSENDVAAAGAFMAALAYSLRHARDGRLADLALASAALGLLAGVKYYAIGYAAVAWTALVTVTWLSRGGRGAARAAIAGLVGILLLAGYWYLRNAWLTGLPLYPRGVSPANDPLAEIRPGVWTSTLLGNGRPEVVPLLIESVRKSLGAAHLVACAMAPTAAAWLCLGGLLRKGPSPKARLVVALTLLAALANWSVIPFCVETTPGSMNMLRGAYLPARFGLCVLTLAVVSFVVLLDDLQGKLRGRVAVALAGRRSQARWPHPTVRVGTAYAPHLLFAGLALSQLAPTPFRHLPCNRLDALLVGVNLGLAATMIGSAANLWRSSSSAAWWAPISIAACSLGIGWLGERWHAGYAPFYDEFFHTKLFSELAEKPPSETRLCACTYRYYPFLGSHRQFRVSRPLWVPTYESLLAYLDRHDATLVLRGV
ncbi:MAG: hypothetical protein B7Z74_05055, partial [Deltaproteobacteria bacterium 21-66-5]